tara:strand:+ start:2741 stop:3400 length:660 start_codon:yes stop_codon:yes gene_type:complete
MKFSLDTEIIYPETKNEIKNAIILLHGYGGDGKDISVLSLNWKRFLPNTIIFCPNGHERCQINPSGYQWFDISREDPSHILKESLKAEEKICSFIEEIKSKFKLKNSQICISGFSQGSMLSINLGLTLKEKFNCIVGFSGKIINKESLFSRIKSKTKMLLIHGEQDEIVPSHYLLEAKDFLLRNKIEVETQMIKNCGHHISVVASSLALDYVKKNLYIK